MLLSKATKFLYQMASPHCSEAFVCPVWISFIPSVSMRDCIYFACPWVYVSFSSTHTDTLTTFMCPQPRNPHQPHFTVDHCAVHPHSWPADPLHGVWQCRDLILVTSSVTMSPPPPPALLSIVRQTVSGLVLVEDGAGAARSLCKWWKRARELCWKRGPCLADRAGRWADRKAPFFPWQ